MLTKRDTIISVQDTANSRKHTGTHLLPHTMNVVVCPSSPIYIHAQATNKKITMPIKYIMTMIHTVDDNGGYDQ